MFLTLKITTIFDLCVNVKPNRMKYLETFQTRKKSQTWKQNYFADYLSPAFYGFNEKLKIDVPGWMKLSCLLTVSVCAHVDNNYRTVWRKKWRRAAARFEKTPLGSLVALAVSLGRVWREKWPQPAPNGRRLRISWREPFQVWDTRSSVPGEVYCWLVYNRPVFYLEMFVRLVCFVRFLAELNGN